MLNPEGGINQGPDHASPSDHTCAHANTQTNRKASKDTNAHADNSTPAKADRQCSVVGRGWGWAEQPGMLEKWGLSRW